MARPTSFGRDTGLQLRMTLTMFLLGLVYAVLVGVVFASGHRPSSFIVAGMFAFQVLRLRQARAARDGRARGHARRRRRSCTR